MQLGGESSYNSSKNVVVETCSHKMKWHQSFIEKDKKVFLKRIYQLPQLSKVRIPWCFTEDVNDRQRCVC